VKLRVLQLAMAFARAFPDGPPETTLTWSHYRHLLALTDAAQRQWYEQEASRRGWASRKLAEAIREGRHHERALPPARGTPRGRKRKLRRPTEATYVYAAEVERVVDGDTLLVVVDLGFEVLKRQRLRLAGLDTPPVDTAKGAKARDFVQEELERVEQVMVKTDKIDLYGRYVAHVFYEPGESSKAHIFAEGRYLNQRLVDRGLAEPL
jgi:endonuclease YncB( thermonuclease family)